MWKHVGLGVAGLARAQGRFGGAIEKHVQGQIIGVLLAANRQNVTVIKAPHLLSVTRSYHVPPRLSAALQPLSCQTLVVKGPQHHPILGQVIARSSITWKRHASSKFGSRSTHLRRSKSSVTESKTPKATLAPLSKSESEKAAQSQSNSGKTSDDANIASTAASTQFLDRLSHLHAPTKDELLAAASGFWSRLAVRFKWFSIRSVRPYNFDEIMGFVSWIVMGHFVWLLIGTTTFFSLLIFMVNTVVAQEALAKWIGGHLTKSSGLQVVFESAIVPKWKNGVISFGNVFVSRRPRHGKTKISKGSRAEAAAAATTAEAGKQDVMDAEDDGNYTQFDITIDTINVTLSFAKWFNGKGLLMDVEMKGVRGIIDRTHVHWTGEPIDPKTYKHEHNTGDFELDSFKMEDLLVTVYQPDNFRPFQISVFSCDLPQLRQQWLFYDFMSANTISGAIDNSLFTLHPRQRHNYTDSKLRLSAEADGEHAWKKQSRLRIDGLNIDHLNRGAEGPFSWIREGNVDIVADIMFPVDDDDSVAKVISDVIDRVEATVTTNSIPPTKRHEHESHVAQSLQTISEGGNLNEEDISAEPAQSTSDAHLPYWIMDMRVHLNDVRAAVPLFTKDISYVNNALIRPIVAYINTRRTFIPISCRVVKERDDFDGSWTLFDSGLMDDMNQEVSLQNLIYVGLEKLANLLCEQVYSAFVRDVLDDAQARRRRIKKVGIWTLQLAAQALFVGMAGNFA